MNEGTRNRRETRAGSLKERFKSNIHMIKKKNRLGNMKKNSLLKLIETPDEHLLN